MARKHNSGRRKINATGRNEGQNERFVALPQAILISAAYRSLDTVARALLVELVMLFNGRNNGSLWLGVQDAVDRLGMSDARPLCRAFDDLQSVGLIAMTKDAHFSIKAAETSRARCWRLTWHAFDRKPASDEWRDYTPPAATKENRRCDKGLRAMARYRKQLAAHKIPTVDFTATPPIRP